MLYDAQDTGWYFGRRCWCWSWGRGSAGCVRAGAWHLPTLSWVPLQVIHEALTLRHGAHVHEGLPLVTTWE